MYKRQAIPEPVWAGEPLTYTLTVSETSGLLDFTGMVVSDTVPLSTTCCLTISHGGFQAGGDVFWPGQAVSASQSISLTFVVTVSQVPNGTVITNEIYRVVTSTQGVTTVLGSPVTTTVRAVPQLSIGKSASFQVISGDLLTYTMVVSETGGAEDATGVLVTDTVPVSTTCCAAIGQGGTLVGSDVAWTGQTVPKGSSMSLTFVVTVSQVPKGTVITNESYRVVTSTQGVTTVLGSPVSTTVGTSLSAVYLPLVYKGAEMPAGAPDLVVESLVATSDSVQVVVRNQGLAPVIDEFWVDAYIDPHPVPTSVNQVWHDLASNGLVWGVTASSLPLASGDAITLTVNDAAYYPEYSIMAWPLTVGTPVYAQVDSVNLDTSYGGVLETHEITGGPYNNIASTVSAAALESVAAEAPEPSRDPSASGHGLPTR